MLKYLFFLFILLHGLIHFMGFTKAFGYGNVTQLTKDISRPAGIFWFISAGMFIIAAIFFLLKKDNWALIAIAAVIISQVLIISVWKDAKYGSIANVIILLAAIPACAEIHFNATVRDEIKTMYLPAPSNKYIITDTMLEKLPGSVRLWLKNSGIVGKENIQYVRLKQKGALQTKPGGKWLEFSSVQYFTVDKPAFNWHASVQMMPLITMNGRDKFENGKGEMLIKILSLFDAVNVGGDTKMNESSMMRYLAETCWFPTAALSDYIRWEAIDTLSAKATMKYKGVSVSGIFQFNGTGDLTSFIGDRWYGSGKTATLEKWFIENKDYQSFQGIRIPVKSNVTWKLKNGDFNWLKLEVLNLEFNTPELYN